VGFHILRDAAISHGKAKEKYTEMSANPGLTLMAQVREVLRSHHDASRTEQT
jgi:hypothetical protein